MKAITIRIILDEKSHDLQLLAPRGAKTTVFAALKEHEDFFVLYQIKEKHCLFPY